MRLTGAAIESRQLTANDDVGIEWIGDRLPFDGTPLLIRQGERNVRLTQFAGMFRRYGLGERTIRDCLGAINRDHVVPPLNDDEVHRIAANIARRYPAGSGTDT